MKKIIAILVIASILTVSYISSAFAATFPKMDRGEIAARAQVPVSGTQLLAGDAPYLYGGESWYPFADMPNDGGYATGTDCSGLVLKAWHVKWTHYYPTELAADRYTAAMFASDTTYSTSVSSLNRGDIYAKSGHTFIFDKTSGVTNRPYVWESLDDDSTGYVGTKHWQRPSTLSLTGYVFKQRKNLDRESTAEIWLDNPTAAYWHDDLGWRNWPNDPNRGAWSLSTSETGYYGDEYAVHQGKGTGHSKKIVAKWTPVIRSSGYYDVYVKWTHHSNRYDKVRYELKTKDGIVVRERDQTFNLANNSEYPGWSKLTTAGPVRIEVRNEGLGDYNVLSGNSYGSYVNVVVNDSSISYYVPTTKYVVADAVRYVWKAARDW